MEHLVLEIVPQFVGKKAQGLSMKTPLFTVHSIFEHSMNVFVNGYLLCITTKSLMRHPFSIIVERPCWNRSVNEGDSIYLRWNRAEFCPISIEFKPVGSIQWIPSIYEKNICLLNRWLIENTHFSDQHGIKKGLYELAREALNGGGNHFKSISMIIGTGEGFTPSGDDILVGILSHIHLISQRRLPSNEMRLIDLFVKTVKTSCPSLTHPVSASLISYAADGDMLQLLRELNETILSGVITPECLSGFLAIGHQSGREMVFGVYLASLFFKRIMREQERRGIPVELAR